jgi:hypothetical protein
VDQKLGSVKRVVMVVFAVLAILPLIFIRLPQIGEIKAPPLTWEQYSDLCWPTGTDNVMVSQVGVTALLLVIIQ